MTTVAVLIEALVSTPIDIKRIVQPLVVLESNRNDNTQIADVVTQLLFTEEIFKNQVARILTEDQPYLSATSAQKSMPEIYSPLPELVNQFQSERDQTVSMLRVLKMKEWQRYGIHSTRGRISLRYLTQGMVENDIAQTSRLVELIQAWRSHRKVSNG